MADFKGWKLFDKVTIVFNASEYRVEDGIVLAFVVDSGNKKQLETAREWASAYNYSDPNDRTSERTITNGKEIELDNDGFTLKLHDSAGQSSQGGKLSFWNCIVSKGDIKLRVGINADMLLDLLMTSTFIDGVCQEPVMFARQSGGLGMIHKNSPMYADAIKDMDTRKTVGKKTSKFILGHRYDTLTQQDTYIGDVWQHLSIEAIPNPNYRRASYYSYQTGKDLTPEFFVHTKLLKEPIQLKVFESSLLIQQYPEDWYRSNKDVNSLKHATTVKELLAWQAETRLNKDLEHFGTWGNYFTNAVEKFPARMDAGQVLNVDATSEDWQQLLNAWQKQCYNYLIDRRRFGIETFMYNRYSSDLSLLQMFGVTINKDDAPAIERYFNEQQLKEINFTKEN